MSLVEGNPWGKPVFPKEVAWGIRWVSSALRGLFRWALEDCWFSCAVFNWCSEQSFEYMSLFKKLSETPYVFWLNTLSKYINHTYLSTFCTVSFNFLGLPFHSLCVPLYYSIRSTSLSDAPFSSRWNFSISFETSNKYWDIVEWKELSKCDDDTVLQLSRFVLLMRSFRILGD